MLRIVAIAALVGAIAAADGGHAYPPQPVTLGSGWTAQWDTVVSDGGVPNQNEGYGGVAFLKNGRVQYAVPFDDLFPDITLPGGARAYRLDARASLRAVSMLQQSKLSEAQVTIDRCAPQCRAVVAYIAIRTQVFPALPHPTVIKPLAIRTATSAPSAGEPLDSVFRIAGSRALPDGRRVIYGDGAATCGTDVIIVSGLPNIAARAGDDIGVYGSWATRGAMSVDERSVGSGATAARARCRAQR